jgi:hypothetical protein
MMQVALIMTDHVGRTLVVSPFDTADDAREFDMKHGPGVTDAPGHSEITAVVTPEEYLS